MKNEWIPVKESLPGPYKVVLLTAYHIAGEPPMTYQGARTGKDEWELFGVSNPEDYIVTAWMPEPEPYGAKIRYEEKVEDIENIRLSLQL